MKIGFVIIFSAILFLIVGHDPALGYWYEFIFPMTIYAGGFGLISAPLNRIVFTCTEEKKGAVTGMFYLIEMGVASLITISLSLLSLYHLVICLFLCSCLSMFLGEYLPKRTRTDELQNL